MIEYVNLPAFFDTHVHLREGNELDVHVKYTTACCDTAIIMPNLRDPVDTVEKAKRYYDKIIESVDRVGMRGKFKPYLSLYLTPITTIKDIEDSASFPYIIGWKLYPENATTGSSCGIPIKQLVGVQNSNPTGMNKELKKVFEAIGKCGLVLNVHGEDPKEFITRREESFLTIEFLRWYKYGRIVLEHVSTAKGIDYISFLAEQLGHKIACGITLHHLYLTLNDSYCQPHNCCWPAPMNITDMRRLQLTAITASPWVFLGSDSAPHPIYKKHSSKSPCGCYTSPSLAQNLFQFFKEYCIGNWSEPFYKFTKKNACEFYNIKETNRTITLKKESWSVPDTITDSFIPWNAGKKLEYSLI